MFCGTSSLKWPKCRGRVIDLEELVGGRGMVFLRYRVLQLVLTPHFVARADQGLLWSGCLQEPRTRVINHLLFPSGRGFSNDPQFQTCLVCRQVAIFLRSLFFQHSVLVSSSPLCLSWGAPSSITAEVGLGIPFWHPISLYYKGVPRKGGMLGASMLWPWSYSVAPSEAMEYHWQLQQILFHADFAEYRK